MNDRLVEQIVSQVMARLGGTPLAGSAAADAPRPVSSDAAAAANALALNEPVVTAETLQQQLNGHRRVAVGRRTVLTPSALDYLRAAGIEWTRGSGGNAAAQAPATGAAWKAIVSRMTPAVERVLSDATHSNSPWRHELAGTAREAAERAVSCICRGEAGGCVVFADGPEAIACLANRNPQARAAAVADAAGVAAAIRHLGANVLCIAPDGRSYFELRNMLRAFTAGGPPQPPAGWSEP